MKLLWYILLGVLLFTHCCFYDNGVLETIEDMVEEDKEIDEMEIDPDGWEREQQGK